MVDYYEFLQISPNADADTVHRVYRFLASRLHPDNPISGNAEQFKLLKTAYDVLSDRVLRAEYDASRRQSKSPEPFSSMVDFMDSLDGELNRRLAVLAVLYKKRRTSPQMPEVSLAEIEERMGFPRDYLDFTLWYLQQKGFAAKGDNAQFALTAQGVDFVEKERGDTPSLNKMLLTSGAEPTSEEIAQAIEEAQAAPAPAARAQAASAASAHGPASLPRRPQPAPPRPQPARTGPIVLPASMEPGTEPGMEPHFDPQQDDQQPEYDQRLGKPERRVGKPDLRTFKIERRFNLKDRRVDPTGKLVVN